MKIEVGKKYHVCFIGEYEWTHYNGPVIVVESDETCKFFEKETGEVHYRCVIDDTDDHYFPLFSFIVELPNV